MYFSPHSLRPLSSDFQLSGIPVSLELSEASDSARGQTRKKKTIRRHHLSPSSESSTGSHRKRHRANDSCFTHVFHTSLLVNHGCWPTEADSGPYDPVSAVDVGCTSQGASRLRGTTTHEQCSAGVPASAEPKISTC